jgi:predicted dehydrogenase
VGEKPIKVPSEQGAYQDFYTQFAAATLGNAIQPVPATEAIGTLEILDAARTSAVEGRVVQVGPHSRDRRPRGGQEQP